MYRILLHSVTVLLFLQIACTDDPAGGDLRNDPISRESALDLVKQKYLDTDSIIAIYSITEILPANTEILVDDYILDTPIVDYQSWFFFVDLDYPHAESPRTCDYVFINSANGEIKVFGNSRPPTDIKSLELVYPDLQSTDPITRQEALDLILLHTEGSLERAAIFANNIKLLAGDTLFLPNRDIFYTFQYSSWFFFIDVAYIINDKWPHWCQYAFVDSETGFVQMFRNIYQPENYSQLDTVYAEWESQNFQKPVLSFSGVNTQLGCGDIRVYIENDDQNAMVNIRADEDSLALGVEWKEFNLTQDYPGLEVYLDFYYYLPPNYWSMTFHYCNDVVSYVRPPKKWYATSGTLKIAISEDNLAALVFTDVRFVDENGENEVSLPVLEISDVHVRWYPG